MTAESRQRFAAVVRAEPVDLGLACALIAVEVQPELDVDAGLRELDRLAADAAPTVGPAGAPIEVAEALRVALGVRAGFAGSPEDYGNLRSSLLPEVLRRRRGLPILLSVVWLEVCRRLGVPAYGVGLPGHFVVAIGHPGRDPVHVDPYTGGRLLTPAALAARVAATGLRLAPGHLEPWWPPAILLRVLTNVRALPGGLDMARNHLWAVELSMLLPHHPAQLRREHGQLLVRLGDFLGGAAELATYADAVSEADPTAAEQALRESRLARARLN